MPSDNRTTSPSGAALPDSAWRRSFRKRLLAWYGQHARDLPWRRRRDPYAVWVSEIMLQQTQVGAVKPYFERFVRAFPTIESLARADEHEVLRLWEGLGYYRRARHLHQAAKIILSEHGGQFPRDPEIVRRLPGIGRYTAGAILSIAFDLREPILEANTVRLFSRLLAYEGDPLDGRSAGSLGDGRGRAAAPRRRDVQPGAHGVGQRGLRGRNAALRVLSRGVAVRGEPERPAARHSAPQGEAAREAVREAAVVIRKGRRVLLLRWPEGRRWAGLWDFPRFVVQYENPAAVRGELVENIRAMLGITITPGGHFQTLTHGVTRFHITLQCYEAEYVARAEGAANALETRWIRPTELVDYPLSSTGRKLAASYPMNARSPWGTRELQ